MFISFSNSVLCNENKNDTGDAGMILQMGKDGGKCCYFDCFFSGFNMEKEYLFIGGSAKVKVLNILQRYI